jgi:hypothetical protein
MFHMTIQSTEQKAQQPPARWKSRWRVLFYVVVLVLGCLGVAKAYELLAHPFLSWHSETATLQVLRDEKLLFLVTDRVVTEVVVSQEDHSLILGGRDGFLIATAKFYYGIDLRKVEPHDISERSGVVIVNVPEPELLDFVVDPERRFISKRTGFVVIADWLNGRDLQTELETQVKTKAMEFVAQNKLFPDRDEVLSQLKLLAPIYGGKIGNKVEFRYRQDDSPK